MYTVCPKCSLTLAVTAADLRAAQGHVRCGRCQNVFNALDTLSDEHPHAPPGTAPAPSVDSAPGDVIAHPEPSAGPPAASEPPGARAQAQAGTPDPAQPATIELEELAELPPPPPTLEGSERAPEAPEGDFALEPGQPHASAGWAVGAVLLAVLLALQIVNHYRSTLATYPSIARPLRTVYGALGIRLAPQWDVRAYEARQLGATVSGTNTREITVRASIANLAQRAQPLPLLRVTLQDRFGRPIAARDVEPRNYLASLPSPPLLPPGGRVDATVVFVNPGPQTVGFEIDACLPEDGTVVCAHGP